jgi:hypothetical protein
MLMVSIAAPLAECLANQEPISRYQCKVSKVEKADRFVALTELPY